MEPLQRAGPLDRPEGRLSFSRPEARRASHRSVPESKEQGVEFSSLSPTLPSFRPAPAGAGLNSTPVPEFSQIWGTVGQHRSMMARHRPSLGRVRFGPEICQAWPTLPGSPPMWDILKSANVTSLDSGPASIERFGPKSANVGQLPPISMPGMDQIWAEFGECRTEIDQVWGHFSQAWTRFGRESTNSGRTLRLNSDRARRKWARLGPSLLGHGREWLGVGREAVPPAPMFATRPTLRIPSPSVAPALVQV